MTDHLVLRSVSKHFGGVRAVDDCSFAIPKGSFVGVIGPNGAGKSTLFNLISGLARPDSGEIRFRGRNLVGERAELIARMGVARTFQTPRAFGSLDAMENMLVAARSSGEQLGKSLLGGYRDEERQSLDRCFELLRFVGLEDEASASCDKLSGGELRMLEVARQLVRSPEILLLDEPTAGVSPHLQERLATLLGQIHGQGVTLVVVEHNLSFLLALAEHVVVMANGSVLTEGLPSDVRRDERVIEAYLGRGHAA